MKLKQKDFAVAKRYEETKPKQFGNLHERMRFAMELMLRHNDVIPAALWHAMYDLETEVKMHEPAMPPFGRRTQELG